MPIDVAAVAALSVMAMQWMEFGVRFWNELFRAGGITAEQRDAGVARTRSVMGDWNALVAQAKASLAAEAAAGVSPKPPA